jgi:hypothetical protein
MVMMTNEWLTTRTAKKPTSVVRRRHHGRRQRHPGVAHYIKDGPRRPVRAGGEEGSVAEREHPGHAKADVEAHRVERPREDLRGEEAAEPAEAGR